MIVKQNNLFAHGQKLREAYSSLEDKLLAGMAIEERIDKFVKKFKPKIKYPNSDFFDWHNKLTGSCLLGRKTFIKNKNIDLDDKSTPEEFIELTKSQYGGKIILKLKEHYS